MSLDVFIARTRSEFLEVAKADLPRPVTRERWWQKLLDHLRLELPLTAPPPGQTASGAAGLLAYAGRQRDAQAGVAGAGMQAVPISWARVKYHAVHTFVVVGDDGVRRHVRFAWQPVAGVCPLDDPRTAATDFLSTEMRQRLKVAPARFELKMTIGDEGDAFDDPTKAWPVTRRVVMMGSLYLDRVADDQIDQCERLSYNPMRLTAGIEASGDEILRARGEVYALAAEERRRDWLPRAPRGAAWRCADGTAGAMVRTSARALLGVARASRGGRRRAARCPATERQPDASDESRDAPRRSRPLSAGPRPRPSSPAASTRSTAGSTTSARSTSRASRIVDDNLLMFSYYDGDFHTYIRDFIVTLGHAFDAIVAIVQDPPPTPCKQHVDEFIEWVHRHDLYQLPDDVTEIADVNDVRGSSRVLTLRMHTNPNVLLGVYRGYPGYSVAQVREHLGMGW